MLPGPKARFGRQCAPKTFHARGTPPRFSPVVRRSLADGAHPDPARLRLFVPTGRFLVVGNSKTQERASKQVRVPPCPALLVRALLARAERWAGLWCLQMGFDYQTVEATHDFKRVTETVSRLLPAVR